MVLPAPGHMSREHRVTRPGSVRRLLLRSGAPHPDLLLDAPGAADRAPLERQAGTVARTLRARMALPALGALLAAGLLLLLPVTSPAAGGRIAPADPAFTQYLQDAQGHRGRSLGLVPAPVAQAAVPRARFAPLMALFPDRFTPPSAAATSSPRAAAATGGARAEASPASYDLVALGKLSPVRDQGRYGTCWAFAALASLDKNLSDQIARDQAALAAKVEIAVLVTIKSHTDLIG